MSGGGAAAARPPTKLPPERETLIQRNLRLKVCAYCKTPGAQLKCEACLQRTYCNKKCQKKDWKTVHRGQCKKLQQVFVPPLPGWREAGGGGGGAAAASGGGAAAAVEDDEFENPCPICLYNKDDARVDGKTVGCVLRADSLTAVLATRLKESVRCNHQTVQPAVHQSMSRGKINSSGCGSWCTTGHQGGTLHLRSTTSVACTTKVKA